jgi:hypothetical protein
MLRDSESHARRALIVWPTIVLPVLLVNPSASGGLSCTRRAITTCPALLAFELRIESSRSSNMNAGVLRCAQNDISIFAFILFFTLLLFRALSAYTQSVSRGPGREGIPNGDTHHLEVCAKEEILYADEIAGRIGTLEG